MKSFLLLAFLMFCSLIVKSQIDAKSFYRYTIKDGLPNNAINCMVHDAYGFIWIGTDNGLSQFDGKSFRNYNYSEIDTLTI